MPELSFGTHFFQDLVETQIFYVALFPDKEGIVFNREWLSSHRNIFEEILPEFGKYRDVINVYDVSRQRLQIMSDVLMQKVICFFSKD